MRHEQFDETVHQVCPNCLRRIDVPKPEHGALTICFSCARPFTWDRFGVSRQLTLEDHRKLATDPRAPMLLTALGRAALQRSARLARSAAEIESKDDTQPKSEDQP